MADIAKFVDKEHEGKSFAEIADLPVEALQGISPRMAGLLDEALRIKTVRDLAESKYVAWAQAIVTLAK